MILSMARSSLRLRKAELRTHGQVKVKEQVCKDVSAV